MWQLLFVFLQIFFLNIFFNLISVLHISVRGEKLSQGLLNEPPGLNIAFPAFHSRLSRTGPEESWEGFTAELKRAFCRLTATLSGGVSVPVGRKDWPDYTFKALDLHAFVLCHISPTNVLYVSFPSPWFVLSPCRVSPPVTPPSPNAAPPLASSSPASPYIFSSVASVLILLSLRHTSLLF